MSFTTGRVSFVRFQVIGDAPAIADEAALSILQERAFRETEIGAPDEIESGFVTGQHLLDTQFTYEKNGFGDAILFAMRIDTHKVPADIKNAYKRINEQAAAEGSPTGFASRQEKHEAAEEAGRLIQADLAAGKFRRSKMIPVLWDLKAKQIYLGASGTGPIEQLVKMMRDAFNVDMDYLSAGVAAGRILRQTGRGRDYEDLKPSAFTAPPARAVADHEDAEYDAPGSRDLETPAVPWVAQAVDLKDFLGNEFLFWLWYATETGDGHLDTEAGDTFIAIDKTLDMDCAWGPGGKQTLRGDGPTRLAEAGEALRTGKWPRKVGMILSDGESQWELAFQADKLIITAAVLPAIEDAQTPREVIEARVLLIRRLATTLDSLYAMFLQQRVTGGWPATRATIRSWIKDRRHGKVAATTQTEPAMAMA